MISAELKQACKQQQQQKQQHCGYGTLNAQPMFQHTNDKHRMNAGRQQRCSAVNA
jgi:hypothetical protein